MHNDSSLKVQVSPRNEAFPSIKNPLNTSSVTVMGGDPTLSLGNTLEKGLFDGGASNNIDGGEDGPQLGEVQV
jgi:hypothetical protein